MPRLIEQARGIRQARPLRPVGLSPAFLERLCAILSCRVQGWHVSAGRAIGNASDPACMSDFPAIPDGQAKVVSRPQCAEALDLSPPG
jgi:hypothetical protein